MKYQFLKDFPFMLTSFCQSCRDRE
eukprot:UN09188